MDTPVLIPNENHRNFTQSGQIIENETILEGEPRMIRGLRKGRPFIYKFFITNEGQIIYLKNVKPMKRQATGVTLGADEQVSATRVNMTSTSSRSNKKYIGAIVGGAAGFAFCKYKKHKGKKMVAYIIGGAIIGFGVGYYLDGGRSRIKVDPSK